MHSDGHCRRTSLNSTHGRWQTSSPIEERLTRPFRKLISELEISTVLKTRLTERLGLRHPIVGAPMAFAAGGRLASAITEAGGLGLIGGGYGDSEWLSREFDIAGNRLVGCGFITWALRPAVMDLALSRNSKAILLSFGDPVAFASRIKNRGVTLICQIQTRRDAERALDCGADVIVAQGSEAGGHGEKRGTFCLVPEVADLIAKVSPETLLCAAGGIGDGRGLASALMLGADGVVVGSRLWASEEANVGVRMHEAALSATGDDTIRSRVHGSRAQTRLARSLQRAGA